MACDSESCGLFGFWSPLSIFGISSAIILVLFLVPVIYYCLYRTYKCVWKTIWDHFTVEIAVSGGRSFATNEDLLYNRLLKWLSDTLPARSPVTATVRLEAQEYGKYTAILTCPPAFGVHYFKYLDRWIRLERCETPQIMSQYSTCELITLTVWRGPGQKQFLEEILKECAKHVLPEKSDSKKIVIYHIYANGEDWEQSGEPKRRRPLSSVILAEGIAERVLQDVHGFIDRKDWYIEREIPHRRGYLFYGPPGCGKTSFIKAIAGEIGYSICVLSLSAKGLTDENLMRLMDYAPENSIILMEDIDAAFKSRENKAATKKETNLAFEGNAPSSVTFRGLLNALDGIASTEGRIVCMTTNYLGKLDPALTRAGRVDQKILIDFPKDDQFRRLFAAFYAGVTEEMKDRFVAGLRALNKNITMAIVQGLFLLHKDSAEDALANLKEYFEEEFRIAEENDMEEDRG